MNLQEIKRIPMVDILARYGLRPNRSGFIHCPFHQGDRTPSFKVYEKDAYCYGCGWHGDQISFVMAMDHLSFKEAFLELGGTYGNAKTKAEDRDLQRKMVLANRERLRQQEDEQRREEERRRQKNYVTMLENGIDHFEPFTENWCFCVNELPVAQYKLDLASGFLDEEEERWWNSLGERTKGL